MVDEIECTKCHKMNGAHKFCIYCGEKLPIDDNHLKLMLDEPNASCLNCGREVKKDQTKCDCGYEFSDIKCPECTAMNKYTNKFCTSCGEKLWKSDIYDLIYDESFFKISSVGNIPQKLQNTSVFMYYKHDLYSCIGGTSILETFTIEDLQLKDLKIDNNQYEICSRWKVVSPNYCINCLSIIKPDEYICPECGFDFSNVKKRVEQIQNEKNKYIEPVFDDVNLKYANKYKETSSYYGPSIGESQFEYKERLKWNFGENKIRKKNIKLAKDKVIIKSNNTGNKKMNGDYCDYYCIYFYEEYLDEFGGISCDPTGDADYLCKLGHTTGGFCKDYQR